MTDSQNAFNGKVVLVTGGGRGIGAATARLFASRGARVAVTSRTQAELDEVRASIEKDGQRVLAISGDVSDESFVRKLFEEIRAKLGPVDVLVNNAAVFIGGELAGYSVADWDRVMAVNLRGPFLCSREAFAHMKGRGGAIVNLSSLGGIQNTEKFKGTGSYAVSKSGVTGLTEILAVEGREHGIRVNCVAPGAVDTVMLKQAAPFLKTRTVPADIASIILYLADSGQSGALTGAVIPVQSNL